MSSSTMQADLKNTQWDCCVIGNGVLPLWTAHRLWTQRKSVLWITETEPTTASKAFVTRGWWWGADAVAAELVREDLTGFDAGPVRPLDVVYYDAKTQKRFRKISEVKPDWGKHESDVFGPMFSLAEAPLVDLWEWQSKLASFHETPGTPGPLAAFELFKEPRFVRVQGWPLLELSAKDGRLTGLTLAGKKPQSITASSFYIGDFEEHLPALLAKDSAEANLFAQSFKPKPTAPGFGLSLRHKADFDPSAVEQVVVIPLLANPSEKGGNSHVVGRFVRRGDGSEKGSQSYESYWIGLLNDEEVEDNNEILKKIKHTKRAIDRAIAGFADSIEREAVTFEPRMMSRITSPMTGKQPAPKASARQQATQSVEVLGAHLFSDRDGFNTALAQFGKGFDRSDEQSKSEESSISPLR